MKRWLGTGVVLVAALVASGCQSGSSGDTEIQVAVTDNGFEPNEIAVKRGQNVTLVITRRTEQTCATDVVVAGREIQKDLPLNEAVSVDLGKVESGPITFACSMDMIKGEVVVRD